MTQTLEAATIPLIDTTPYTDSSKAIELTDKKLIEMFDLGILNPIAYISFALQFEDLSRPLDLESFCFRWRGSPNPETNKVKEIKPIQVKRALLALEEKGAIDVPEQKIQLSLNL